MSTSLNLAGSGFDLRRSLDGFERKVHLRLRIFFFRAIAKFRTASGRVSRLCDQQCLDNPRRIAARDHFVRLGLVPE